MNAPKYATHLAVLSIILTLFSGLAHADRDDWRRGDDWRRQENHDRYDRQRYDRHEQYVARDRRDQRDQPFRKVPQGYIFDKRYHHDRYYPRSGLEFKQLPSNPYHVHYRDYDYYYHGGIWYRPYRSRFIVVTPPLGLYVPTLPAFYTTIWFGGIPYYYANDVYYVWDAGRGGYVVTEAPANVTAQEEPPVASEQLFIYPNRGQSEKQQADDRYACHQWGVKQTGFDPTQPPDNLSQGDINQKQMDYQRAMKACLEGRGYTVR